MSLTQEVDCFVGLDVGRETMEAVWIDSSGKRQGSMGITNNHKGYKQFLVKLENLEKNGSSPVVGVEGHSGEVSPLDQFLLDEDYALISIQPSRVDSHKDVLGQPKKTDRYDAYVIADFLWSRAHQLDELPRISPKAQRAKKLSRTFNRIQKERTRYINRLRQNLTEYFPEYLQEGWLSLTSKASLKLLKTYPSLHQLKQLGTEELTNFLRDKSGGHYGKYEARTILNKVNTITRSPVVERAYTYRIQTNSRLLLALETQKRNMKKDIADALKNWEDAEIVKSLPGAGNLLTAQLLGEIGTIDRFESSDAFALYCGVAPIPYASGNYKTDVNTPMINRIAKDALMQLAQSSKRYGSASQKYYEKKRSEGKSHWHALKCLARNLARVIYAMLRDRTYYQSERSSEGTQEDQQEVVATAS